MVIKKGIATKLRNVVDVRGSQLVISTHIALFQLDGQQIRFKSNEPIMIENNDTVVIYGQEKNAVFDVLAYKNLTTGAEGNAGQWTMLVFGAIFLAISLMAIIRNVGMFSSPLLSSLDVMWVIVLVCICIGIYLLKKANDINKAICAVRSTSRTANP